MTQVVELLPSKHKALSSNPSTAKTTTKTKKLLMLLALLLLPLRLYAISSIFSIHDKNHN
jgi:hypothetical protein